jgi:hypothetical protein
MNSHHDIYHHLLDTLTYAPISTGNVRIDMCSVAQELKHSQSHSETS